MAGFFEPVPARSTFGSLGELPTIDTQASIVSEARQGDDTVDFLETGYEQSPGFGAVLNAPPCGVQPFSGEDPAQSGSGMGQICQDFGVWVGSRLIGGLCGYYIGGKVASSSAHPHAALVSGLATAAFGPLGLVVSVAYFSKKLGFPMSYASLYPRRTFRGLRGFGEDVPAIAAFLPANPFAVPLAASAGVEAQAMTMADCGPGMSRDPILGFCLPTGSDPTKCPPGMIYTAGKGCTFIPQSTGCPAGTVGDPAGISCWPTSVPAAQPQPPTSGGGCPTGYVKDPVLGTTCIPTFWPVGGQVSGQGIPSAPGCLLGQVKDGAGNCVFPFCPPGLVFDVTTGACGPGGTQGGFDIVRQACDLLPAAIRPSSCPTPGTDGTSTGTSSTSGASLSMLCNLIPSGWPLPPGCGTTGPSTVTPGGAEIPGTKTGGSVTTTTSSGIGVGGVLALAAGVGVIGGIAWYVGKKKKARV